jgi:hypothetical protein
MSDVDSVADSISDSNNAHVYTGANEALISSTVRLLCDRLRANDPRVLDSNSGFSVDSLRCSEAEQIAVFQALMENTSVKYIRLSSHNFTKRSAEVAAEYVKSSKTLQTIHLFVGFCRYPYDIHEIDEIRRLVSILFRALSRSTSVTKLVMNIDVLRFGCVAFQELLTRTQTLQIMAVTRYHFQDREVDDVCKAAITSGFASNTTLRDLEFWGWRETDLFPVLTALQEHPGPFECVARSYLSFEYLWSRGLAAQS